MVEDEAADPVDVRLLGAGRVVFEAQAVADLIQQFSRRSHSFSPSIAYEKKMRILISMTEMMHIQG
jgi:hypothetical protein